jgi:hypothetical protein
VTQGERERVITMWAAGMRQLSVQFAKGDRHARRDAIWIAERLGAEFLTPKKAFDETFPADRRASSTVRRRRVVRPSTKFRRGPDSFLVAFAP